MRGGAVRGFDERLFGAEDAAKSGALKREGRFVVIWDSVVTSGRRMRGLAGFRMLLALFYMAFYPRMLTRRASVKKVWYESDRGADKHACDSLVVRALNVFMLLVRYQKKGICFWERTLLDEQPIIRDDL